MNTREMLSKPHGESTHTVNMMSRKTKMTTNAEEETGRENLLC